MHPYFTQTGKDRIGNGDQYIANMYNGAAAGFKYFAFDGTEKIISVNGRGKGGFIVSTDPAGRNIIAKVRMNCSARLKITAGIHALYFTYRGRDAADFISFEVK